MKFCKAALAAATVLTVTTAGAIAAGIPVYDSASIAQAVKQFEQDTKQLKQLEEQLKQAQELYGSLNGLTDMKDLQSILSRPEIKDALPKDFAAIEGLLSGNGEGKFGDSAARFLEQNTTYKSDANDFYAKELAKTQKRNAGQMTLGEQIYNSGTERMKNIEKLRDKLSKSTTAKDTADLQALIQTETASLQADSLRMQGLAMVQQAQMKIAEQREVENRRQTYEALAKKYGGK
ncbi:type IV secretion system protein VirB5 [Ochrobactrum anthropi]|uniref:P-type DNA transfer protein VirB5 n=1 Tax=Brucella anthropi TaxID=529 RepID=UPI0015FD0144|nr:P-type DNA transfer protein VirB5 [Brucella anthropi]MBA8862731.1 type IV secretion system protein VirB5 [Brucella anthropi]